MYSFGTDIVPGTFKETPTTKVGDITPEDGLMAERGGRTLESRVEAREEV